MWFEFDIAIKNKVTDNSEKCWKSNKYYGTDKNNQSYKIDCKDILAKMQDNQYKINELIQNRIYTVPNN